MTEKVYIMKGFWLLQIKMQEGDCDQTGSKVNQILAKSGSNVSQKLIWKFPIYNNLYNNINIRVVEKAAGGKKHKG